jgi:hypothetical protein
MNEKKKQKGRRMPGKELETSKRKEEIEEEGKPRRM